MKKLHFVLAAMLLLGMSATTVVMAQKSTAKKAAVAAPAVQAPNVDSILFSEVKMETIFSEEYFTIFSFYFSLNFINLLPAYH